MTQDNGVRAILEELISNKFDYQDNVLQPVGYNIDQALFALKKELLGMVPGSDMALDNQETNIAYAEGFNECRSQMIAKIEEG